MINHHFKELETGRNKLTFLEEIRGSNSLLFQLPCSACNKDTIQDVVCYEE